MNKPTFNSTRLRAAALAMTLSLGLVQTFLAPAAAVAATEAPVKLQSLRGAEINASDPEGDGTRYGRDQQPLPRDFVQQPPLIPHTIKGYTVTKNFNKCLDCHAWVRAKETGATKISVTHFKDREGQELSSVSPRRYFCNQCHVPQSDAKPLVGNTFKPGTGMR
mgnify:FL=1